MQQVKYYDLSYQVYQRIKEMILSNQFKPGEKLLQEKIAAELGVSRTPLHKAFQMLENEYLVESIPRRGMFVKKIDLKQIKDAFECREAIEGIAARRVATQIQAKDLKALKKIFEPFTADRDNIDEEAYRKADREFHNLILHLSGNEILIKMDVTSNVLVRTYTQGLVRNPSETLDEHIGIIQAIELGDGDMAEKRIREHSRKSNRELGKRAEAGFNSEP